MLNINISYTKAAIHHNFNLSHFLKYAEDNNTIVNSTESFAMRVMCVLLVSVKVIYNLYVQVYFPCVILIFILRVKQMHHIWEFSFSYFLAKRVCVNVCRKHYLKNK